MKPIYFLILFFPLLSISQNKHKLRLELIDGYFNKPLKSKEVSIRFNKTGETKSFTTDENGVLVIPEYKQSKLYISISDKANDFNTLNLNHKLKGVKSKKLRFYLFPSDKYESAMFKIEDEKYGPDTLNILEEELKHVKNPEYEGGYLAMMRAIQSNFRYPEIAREMGDQGTVYIRFIIETDGTLTHAEVLQGVTNELDEESLRVVRTLDKFNPGKFKGKITRLAFVLPIKCRLG